MKFLHVFEFGLWPKSRAGVQLEGPKTNLKPLSRGFAWTFYNGRNEYITTQMSRTLIAVTADQVKAWANAKRRLAFIW